MEIKILGPGCRKCDQTAKLVNDVVAEIGVEAQVEKVTNTLEIAGYGVFGTPAVVAPHVTDGYAPQIRLPEEAAQHVPAAIPDSNGAQYDSFTRSHTAILA